MCEILLYFSVHPQKFQTNCSDCCTQHDRIDSRWNVFITISKEFFLVLFELSEFNKKLLKWEIAFER